MDVNNHQKSIRFSDHKSDLEMCHNLVAQVHPNPHEDVEYATDLTMTVTRVRNNINKKVTVKAASFLQQYILKKELEKISQKGHQATMSELDQLHRCSCFMPIPVKGLLPSEDKK